MRKASIFFRKYGFIPAAAVVGMVIFLAVYSPEPLHFSNVSWMMYGYQGHDIIQHQTGWMFFRNSPWTFPLGKALNLGYPQGTAVSFTDSIPVAAVFFKLFSPFFGDNFQYFGLYVFFCFAAQCVFAAALIYFFTKNRLYALAGAPVFVIVPIFLERCFHHTALASHWLLLAGLLFYFIGRKRAGRGELWAAWCVLLCLAEGTHPYLFAMVLGIFCLSRLELFLSVRKKLRVVLFSVLCGIIVYLFGFCLGLYGETIKPAAGFGSWNMNLNALFNPGGYNWGDWSLFLDPRPFVTEIPDGTMYLGLAALVLFPAAVLVCVIFRNKWKIQIPVGLFLLLLFYTLFALSNVLTFDDRILFSYSLPETVMNIANIFRASLRFFFVPYYCILLFIVTVLYRLFRSHVRIAVVFCLLFVCLQVVDLSPVLRNYHSYYEKRYAPWEFSEDWDRLAASYDSAFSFDRLADRVICYWLGKNGFKTNMNIASPIRQENYWISTEEEREKLRRALAEGSEVLDLNAIYVISERTGEGMSFPDRAALEDYLEQVRTAYAGKADLIHLEDFARSYWILCPVK